jgi:hypothetical protein
MGYPTCYCTGTDDKGGDEMNLTEIIELLECAKINADNIKKAGVVFVDVVKMQIDEAYQMNKQARQ